MALRFIIMAIYVFDFKNNFFNLFSPKSPIKRDVLYKNCQLTNKFTLVFN